MMTERVTLGLGDESLRQREITDNSISEEIMSSQVGGPRLQDITLHAIATLLIAPKR